MGDIRCKPQLLSGWYPIEDGAWRWMAGQAEAVLRTPAGVPLRFNMQLYFPPNHMQRAGGPVTVSIKINGKPLTEETYSQPGEHRFSQAVLPDLPTFPASKVSIRLNRTMPPSDSDQRELGAVVLGLGFVETK